MTRSAASTSFAILLLLAAVWVVYRDVSAFEFLTWDDDTMIRDNPVVHTGSLRDIFGSYIHQFYTPLAMLSFRLEYALFGLEPTAFHRTNLLLHGLSSVLVYVVLRRWTGGHWAACLAALLFAVHPLNAEPVSWLSTRKHLLTTPFVLLTLLTFSAYLQSRRSWQYALSLGLSLCALLSSALAVSIPLVLLLITWWRGKLHAKTIKLVAPFFALAVLFGLIALFGKAHQVTGYTGLHFVLLVVKGYVTFIWKLLLPTDLSLLYFQTTPVSLTTPDILWSLLAFAALALACVAIWHSWNQRREFLFGLGLMTLLVLPSLFVLVKGSGVHYYQDRYAYLPMIGLLFIMSVGLVQLRAVNRTLWRVVTGALLSIILVFAVLAHQRSMLWRDSLTFYTAALAQYPDSELIQLGYGHALFERGQTAAAIEQYRDVLRKHPESGWGRELLEAAQAEQ